MIVRIPLFLRKRKKKAYCKKCLWKEDEYACVVKETKSDYNSKRHSVAVQRFSDLEKQNENNDCEFYCHNFLWWLI